jgi:hypothetical protein
VKLKHFARTKFHFARTKFEFPVTQHSNLPLCFPRTDELTGVRPTSHLNKILRKQGSGEPRGKRKEP